MKFAITYLAAAGLAIAASASPARSADTKTWYVYCEGSRQGDHWAVFSENFWPHPLTEGYGRDVASAAKAFFESRHDVRLEGCAGVNFVDSSLAEHSRSRTAELHRNMGDRVLYLRLPSEALPAPRPAEPEAMVAADMNDASDTAPGDARPVSTASVSASTVDSAGEPKRTFTPQRAER